LYIFKNQAFKLFSILTLFFFLMGGLVSLFVNQIEIIQKINQYNSPFFDFFFQYFTYLGDGMICIILIIVFMKNKAFRFNFAISSLLILIVSSVLKMIIFKDSMRPITFFENNLSQIHTIPSVLIFSKYSFPSGHTMVAFGMASLLSTFFKDKIFGFIFFVLALLVGFSRIYLFQHFLIDVIFGAIIGLLISCIVLIINQLRNETK
jgi:membrane-associated phospholipid phosphatase